jgi:uncharacterized membrane protein
MALELVVWVSEDAGTASRALQSLKASNAPAAWNAAVLIRDRDGQLQVFETGRVDGRHGTVPGVIVGLLMVLFGGSDPGHIAGQAVSMGFPEGFVTTLQASTGLWASALVMFVRTDSVAKTLELLEIFEGRAWRQTLSDGLLAHLSAGARPEEAGG